MLPPQLKMTRQVLTVFFLLIGTQLPAQNSAI